MKQLTDKHWAVEVPDKFAQITIDPVGPVLMWWSYEGIEDCRELPPGTWRFLFTTKTATEEEARKVVEHDDFIGGYKDYDIDRFHHEDPFIKAIDSLNSLLHSKGLDPNKNYALIENQSSDE